MGSWTKWYRSPTPGTAEPQSLFLTGALLAVEVHLPIHLATALTVQGKPVPAAKAGWGLIDTGATFTCVHEQVFKDLGVPPVGVAKMGTANGLTDRPTYPARIVFPETGWDMNVPAPLTSVDLSGQEVHFQGAAPQPIIMLIGRDLLRGCVLVWNGPAATWSISY